MTIFDFYDLIGASEEEKARARHIVEAASGHHTHDSLQLALYIIASRIKKLETENAEFRALLTVLEEIEPELPSMPPEDEL